MSSDRPSEKASCKPATQMWFLNEIACLTSFTTRSSRSSSRHSAKGKQEPELFLFVVCLLAWTHRRSSAGAMGTWARAEFRLVVCLLFRCFCGSPAPRAYSSKKSAVNASCEYNNCRLEWAWCLGSIFLPSYCVTLHVIGAQPISIPKAQWKERCPHTFANLVNF